MKELIKYVKSVKAAHINDIERLYVNNEVKETLKKHNLTLIELIYRVKRDIPLNKILTCERCGKKIEFNKKCHSYSRFCGHKCANIATVQSQNFKEKAINSWNERKAKEYEAVEEILKQYKLTLDEYKYRIKNGIPLDKVFLCKECGKPIKFTKKHKYKTFCNNFCSSRYIAKQPKSIMKRQATIRKKYGVDNVSQNKDIQQKKYDTMKINGTYNTSDFEEQAAILLSEKFPDTKRQFRSKEYPFNCDFYIPSLNLYIEFNGHWTHGLEPYDPNNPEHIKILNFWKSKNTDFYRSAIHTWTIRDPLKVKTAKENNLNFKVFWTLEEVQEWLKII